ncbi:MAG: ABC transporter substrate-binding protein [Bifidobacteriaceae bacterium]|jgi:putative ABC transport system substrate-binding protein|nr:ABC transporter substrate-binding protein [Bifidobacteriaceae bacterium]
MKTRSRLAALAALAAVAATAAVGGLAGCGGAGKADYTIAITQIVAHPSLDLITQGFKDGLEEKGVDAEFIFDDAQGDQANTVTIAGKYAADSDIDLILAVATNSAQAVVNQVSDRPVLFAGVTDPVEAGLVPSWEPSGTNVTGTSDLNPEGRPAALIQDVLGAGNVKTIGYLYSLGEKNSVVQLDLLKAEAEPLGMTVKESGIANSSELTAGAEALADVDVIYVGTDNTVVDAIEQVVSFGQSKKIPVFVADAASVERGGLITRGIDYYELGKRTAEQAYEILVNGAKPGDIAPLQVTDTEIVVNEAAAAAYGVTIPPAILETAEKVG